MMRNYSRRFRLLADLLVFDAGAIVAYALRFHAGVLPTPYGIPPAGPYLKLLLLANLFWLTGALLGFAYRKGLTLEASLRALTKLYLFTCFGILLFTFLYRTFTFSITVVLSSLAVALPLTLITHARFRERLPVTKVALAGTAAEISAILAQGRPPQGGMVRYQQALWIDGMPDGKWPVAGEPWRADLPLAPELREVWLTGRVTADPEFSNWLAACTERGVAVRLVTFLPGVTGPGLPLLTQLVPLNCLWHPLREPHNRLVKRAFDLCVTGIAALAAAPLLAAVALLILWRDGRPVFIRQKRLTRDGQTFRMLKFRTMRHDAEEDSGPVWAQANDARCTTIGLWLRRYSLDELPQLWNVLRGDMSLVGPRPERPYFVRKFAGEMCYYDGRHSVQTGITGWAQANGLRGNTSIELRTLYDLYYIEHWSAWFDLKIIFLTLREFLFHQTAY